MKFLSDTAIARCRGADGQIEWSRVWRDYDAHVARIWPSLSPGWRKLAKLDLHDARLVRVDCPKKREVVVQLDAARLEFRGVSHLRMPTSVKEDYWIYSEIALGKKGDVVIEIRFGSFIVVIAAEDVTVLPKEPNQHLRPTEQGKTEDSGGAETGGQG